MASEALTGRRRAGGGDAVAQCAVGWVLGMLAVQVVDDWPNLFPRWKRLAKAKPFWS
jgi:hypothetical protein